MNLQELPLQDQKAGSYPRSSVYSAFPGRWARTYTCRRRGLNGKGSRSSSEGLSLDCLVLSREWGMDYGDYYWGLYRDYCRDQFPHSRQSTRQNLGARDHPSAKEIPARPSNHEPCDEPRKAQYHLTNE